MNDFFTGFNYALAGFSLITKPGLRRFVIIPIFINVIFFLLLFLFLRHYFIDLNLWLMTLLPTWLHWLHWLLWLLFFASFFLIFVYLFVTIANVIAAPFNSFLSEKVEYHLTNRITEPRTLWENIKDIPRILARQLAIIGYYLPRACGILLLFLIPVVHLAAVVLWFAFNAWFLSLTYLDYPSDNQRVALIDVREWQQANRMLTLGFGLAILLSSMVPFINFLTIPAAVAGATKLWIEKR